MDLASKYFKSQFGRGSTLQELYFEKGYNLTVTEAAGALDVSERYLMDVFGDSFDYVLVPASATQCFKWKMEDCYEQLKSKGLKANEKIALEKDIKRYKFLVKKRIFINFDSFINFLTKNLYRDSTWVAIRLTNEEKQKLTQEQLEEVVERVLMRFRFDDLDRRLVTEREALRLIKNPILSGVSIKAKYLRSEHALRVNSLRRTVHDMQLHRFLNRLYSNSRYTIRGAGDERDVVRYHVEFDCADEEIEGSFLVPYCVPAKQRAIKEAVIKEIKVYREDLLKQRKEQKKLNKNLNKKEA